jgi:hypothetical protein
MIPTRSVLRSMKLKLTALAADLDALEALLDVDVPSSLNKIRFITERVLAELCARHQVTWGQAEPTLERMLGPLKAAKVIPKNVAVHVSTIQVNTSPGSHFQESALAGSHVEIAQAALVEFLEWHARQTKGVTEPPPLPPPRPGKRMLVAIAVGAILAALAVAVGLAVGWRPEPLTATLQMHVWKREEKSRSLELRDPDAVPLRAGDLIRIDASANRPAYLYLVNLDSTGKALPLYPWRDGDWRKRREERPLQTLSLPDSSTGSRAAPLSSSPDGTESIVLLARDRPLTDDENDRVVAAFLRNEGRDGAGALVGAVLIRSGGSSVEFTADKDRAERSGPRGFVEPTSGAKNDDVVQRLQRLLSNELKPLAGDSVAVCYPFRQK